MPGPVSRTDIWNEPLFASALMAISPASVNLMAFPTRLIRTCVSRRPSPWPGGSSGAISTLKASFLSAANGSSVLPNGLGNVLNAVIRKFEFELTGLDLRQIKHIIDESEQVFAVSLKAFEYAEHLFGRLAIGAVRHQFGIAQDGVERRAQLVAHIGKEL